jgi:hypothetical protein
MWRVGRIKGRGAPRAGDDPRKLRRLAEPPARLAEVAELRHRIGTVAAA